MRARLAAAAGITLSLLVAACSGLFRGDADYPEPPPAVATFERAERLGILLEPDFSVPTHLRPCCAFGRDLEVSVTQLPVPLVALSNVADPRALGTHAYDGGLIALGHGVQRGFVSGEANGLVYTCRAGFIDTAHIRDYADWTVFLARRLEATLATGLALELPEEGARRFVFVRAVDREQIERVGLRPLAAQLAQWLAFQLSLWHETATWYGWSSIGIFPERASAFSPEDLYSNLLGTTIASYIVQAGMAETEEEYSAAMDETVRATLALLGAMPPDTTRRALDAVQGSWWSSENRLPDPKVVMKRSIQLGPEVSPWTIPFARFSPALQMDHDRHCSELPDVPTVLRYPDEVEGVPFSEIARIEYWVDDDLEQRLPMPRPGDQWVSSRDVPAILEHLRSQSRAEFGQWHDQPGGVDE